ncbi:WSC domain-containing protein [Sarocladium implicatum]|nr:WSC domain-containing protein [Sarocladium implicatum]
MAMDQPPVPVPLPLAVLLATTTATTLVPTTVPTAHVGIRQERLTVASVSDYSYLGCYEDYESADRVLQGASTIFDGLNPAWCCSWCLSQDSAYTLCGAEVGNQCFCGSTTLIDSPTTDGCKSACNGDKNSRCGGFWAIDLYSSTVAPTAQDFPGCTNLGCFTDYSDDGRILKATQTSFDELNPQTCCKWCTEIDSDYRYCGVEFGNQCRCDSTVKVTDSAYSSECAMPCWGQPNYQCGSAWRINLYEAATATVTTTTTSRTGSTGEAAATTASTGDDTEGKDSSKLSDEAIIGIVFGIVAAIGVIVALWRCCRPR